MHKEKTRLLKEEQATTRYILELEKKCFQANKTTLEHLARIHDYEVEVESLKTLIIELKNHFDVYVPVKGDLID